MENLKKLAMRIKKLKAKEKEVAGKMQFELSIKAVYLKTKAKRKKLQKKLIKKIINYGI